MLNLWLRFDPEGELEGGVTHRLVFHIAESLVVGVDNLALDLIRPSTVISQAARAIADVCFRHSQGLAVIQRFDGGQRIEVLFK